MKQTKMIYPGKKNNSQPKTPNNMANKIRSLELENGTTVDFLDAGRVDIKAKNGIGIIITEANLKTILTTLRQNQNANGVIKDTVKEQK